VLSRIARALYETGRDVERAQDVVRVLEVQHKMDLGPNALPGAKSWSPIFEAFGVEDVAEPSEVEVYEHLVLGRHHPYAVRGRITVARERARTLRDRLSEEMWEHLNRFHLELAPLTLLDVQRLGFFEVSRRIAVFCDAFYGLADDTMIHGPEWHVLRIGKFLERGSMLCRILEIKRKSLDLAPEQEGRPVDFRQWQSMLRTVSGYEPYRRVYDARILPSRVLELVLENPAFPRSFRHCLERIEESLAAVGVGSRAQRELLAEVRAWLAETRWHAPGVALGSSGLEGHVRLLQGCCTALERSLEKAFFDTLHPAPLGPLATGIESGHVPVPQ